jgi:hypothetical protein
MKRESEKGRRNKKMSHEKKTNFSKSRSYAVAGRKMRMSRGKWALALSIIMLMMYVSPVASQSKESSPVPREGG